MSNTTEIKDLSGNINLLKQLAEAYYNGEVTEKNLEKVLNLYQKVAENGYIKGQNNLALLYEKGEGIEKNLVKAFYWYNKAAENKNNIAQNNLALLYEKVKE